MHTGTIYLLILLNILDLILLNADTYYSINKPIGERLALGKKNGSKHVDS